MSQNRDAPAYQEYAATILAQLPFRTMSLQERGLLYTMRLECWVNIRLPKNQNDLAKVLGLQLVEVTSSFAAVMPFFEVVGEFVICPELENYRAYLAERRNKQSEGGKLGSDITKTKRNNKEEVANQKNSANPQGTPHVPRRVDRDSLAQSKAEQPSQNQSSGGGNGDPWLEDYAKGSRGQ